MSILIKGMTIPKSCFDCPFMYGRKYCQVNSKIEFNDPDYSELKGRYDGCPLVPVPDGRWIDADALRQAMYHEAFETGTPMQKWDSGCWIRYKMFERLLASAPTIIKAEEGES